MIQLSNFHFGNRSTMGVKRRARLFLLAFAVATVFFGTDRGTSGKAAADQKASGDQRLHVYVHYDYMVAPDGTSDAPDPEAIDMVRQAFDAHGIDLVIDSHHTAIRLWPMVNFAGDIGTCVPPEQTINFDTLKAQNFHPTSNHQWHYAIFGRVNDNVAAGAVITNSATVTSSTPDPDLSDNTATTTVVFPFQ